MRVLQVTPRYLPHVGGIETHVKEVTRRLTEQDVDLSIFTTVVDEAEPGDGSVEGIPIRRFRSWPRNRDYCFSPDLFKAVLHADCDLIHIQGVHTFVAPLAMAAANRAGIPYVLTFHTGGHSSGLRRLIRSIQWRSLAPLLRKSALLIGVSEFERDYFASILGMSPSRLRVVPNGGVLTVAPTSTPAPGSGKLIVSSGRLERYKGHHRAIAALPDVLRTDPDARLVILGRGPYEGELRHQVQDLGLEEHVEITSIPADERGRMATLLASASVVLLLSDYEAHPVAAMEAIALRRPVLVLDNSGLGELARKGLATSIPTNSSSGEIGRAITKQLHCPTYPAEVALPTWDDCAASLLEIYREVVGVPVCA